MGSEIPGMTVASYSLSFSQSACKAGEKRLRVETCCVLRIAFAAKKYKTT
jgi:hypothetical protein